MNLVNECMFPLGAHPKTQDSSKLLWTEVSLSICCIASKPSEPHDTRLRYTSGRSVSFMDLPLIVLVMISATSSVHATSNETEDVTLRALYSQTTQNGPWWCHRDWLNASVPHCTWQCVSCDGDGHVTSLSLFENNMVGSLPDLTNLAYLELLDLRKNSGLSGTLPPLPASLTNLRLKDALHLQISTQRLSFLTQLEELQIVSVPNLEGEFPEVSAMSNLNTLWVYIGYKYVGKIFMRGITGTLPDLSQNQKLTSLYLGDMLHITGPFPDVANLTQMSDIGAQNLPLVLSSMPSPASNSLTSIDFENMPGLTGTIPTGRYPNLQALELKNTSVTDVPNLSELTLLTTVFLKNNAKMVGTIPSVSNLSRLQKLTIASSPYVTGSIPSLQGPTSLQKAVFYNNNLSGMLPNMTSCTDLNWFQADWNPLLRGNIATFENNENLRSLILSNTSVTGTIPVAISASRFLSTPLRISRQLDVQNSRTTATQHFQSPWPDPKLQVRPCS